MIAYSKTWLQNLDVRSLAREFLDEQCITAKEFTALEEHYPVGFYTTSFFARIGLFLFTGLIVLGVVFLGLMMGTGSSVAGTCIFFALVTYGVLERMVFAKHYRSGVDDALTWMSPALLVTGLNVMVSMHGESNSLVIFLLSLWIVLRFADAGMAAVACTSLYLSIYFILSGFGETANSFLPFILMITGVILFLLVRKLERREEFWMYRLCLVVMRITLLVLIYLAGNYFVIQHVHASFSGGIEEEKQTVPFGWLFWIFTCIVPVCYLITGILKKDKVFLRTGLVLIAAMIITIRYYYQVIPAEVAMLSGGALLIIVSAFFLRFLKTPVNRITSAELNKRNSSIAGNLEALVIVQTLGTQHQPDSGGVQFGGGSGGGGGAGGEY